MAQIQMCKYLEDDGGGILMLCVQSGQRYQPDIHVFQCNMNPVRRRGSWNHVITCCLRLKTFVK